ncbi:hypothetical protein PYCC9005_004380 [Savitreella phatthalungensis]
MLRRRLTVQERPIVLYSPVVWEDKEAFPDSLSTDLVRLEPHANHEYPDVRGSDVLMDVEEPDDRQIVLCWDTEITLEHCAADRLASILAARRGAGLLLLDPELALEDANEVIETLQRTRTRQNAFYRFSALLITEVKALDLAQAVYKRRVTLPETVLITHAGQGEPSRSVVEAAQQLSHLLPSEQALFVFSADGGAGVWRYFGGRCVSERLDEDVADRIAYFLGPRVTLERFDALACPSGMPPTLRKWLPSASAGGPGVPNLRDTAVGHFPRGLLYRSADLQSLAKESQWRALAEKIRCIIDLRSMPEVRRNGALGPVDHANDTSFEDEMLRKYAIRRIHAPIFLEKDYSPEAIARRHSLYKGGSEGFVEAYKGILTNLGPTIQLLVQELVKSIDARREPWSASATMSDARGVLIHCSAGKDRTGVLCVLMLKLAAIEEWAITYEYALTRRGLRTQRERILTSVASLAADSGHRDGRNRSEGQDEALRRAMSMMDAPPHVMRRTLYEIREHGDSYSPCKDFSGWQGGQVANPIERFLLRKGVPSKQLDILVPYLQRDAGPLGSNSQSGDSRWPFEPPLEKL